MTVEMFMMTFQILGIRKMIADGVLPENYNYNDVPLLNGVLDSGHILDAPFLHPGDFINVTHVMRDGSLLNIHEQDTHEHRVRDFKRSITSFTSMLDTNSTAPYFKISEPLDLNS